MMQDNLHRWILAASWLAIGLAVTRGASFNPDLPKGPQVLRDAPAHRIVVSVDGRNTVLHTTAANLGEALAEAPISLGEQDKVYPVLSTRTTDGLEARIIRIQTKLISTTEIIPRQTIRKPSGSLRRGASSVALDGRDGSRQSTYQITLADGRRIMKKLVDSRTVAKPTSRVILYGQGIVLPSRGFLSHRVMTMTATAYDPYNCGGSGSGRTASGIRAGRGVVAVDPRVIRLGTKLYIEGYGFAVAGDTGGAIKGRKIDLGHDSNRSARQFGRKKVVVHVID